MPDDGMLAHREEKPKPPANPTPMQPPPPSTMMRTVPETAVLACHPKCMQSLWLFPPHEEVVWFCPEEADEGDSGSSSSVQPVIYRLRQQTIAWRAHGRIVPASSTCSEARRDGCQTRRVAPRLRIATHVGIRVHPLHIPLYRIRRQEHAHYRVIVPGVVVIQPRQRIVVLAGEAFGRVERTGGITRVAIGSVELVARERGAVGRVGEA